MRSHEFIEDESPKMKYEWIENLSVKEWDYYLSQLHGHPLQSAKWGDAKKNANGINDYRWVACKDGSPVFMARFEERRLFKFIKIAWCPKGPLIISETNDSVIKDEFLSKLRNKKFFLCITNPWKKIDNVNESSSVFYTIMIDLTISKEKLWENLHKKCRSDIKRSNKLGVRIEQTKSVDDIQKFYAICELISKEKGFKFGSSLQLMSNLLINENDKDVESVLFIAKHEGNLCGGAFILRCGESVHYLWGAVNRVYSQLCVGEALQWHVIEWATSKNCKKYDLGGISAQQDGGVDKFKKKLGGTVIACHGLDIYSLYISRLIVLPLVRVYLTLKEKVNRFKYLFI